MDEHMHVQSCVGEDVHVVAIQCDGSSNVVSKMSIGVFHYDGHDLRAGAHRGVMSDSLNDEGSTRCEAITRTLTVPATNGWPLSPTRTHLVFG